MSEGYSLYERHGWWRLLVHNSVVLPIITGSLVTSDERNSGPLHAQRNEEISFSKVPTPPDCSQAFDRSKRKRMAMQFSSPLSQYASGSSVAEPPDVILSLSSSINVSGSLSTASKGSTSTTFDRSAGSYSGAVTDLEHNILGIKGWELDDLLKDGKLDVDAVNNILGLNTMSADDLGVLNTISGHPPLEIEYGRMHDRDLLGQHIRSPGKPLCVIPEETEDIIEHVADIPSSASFWDNRLSSDKYSSKRNSTCLEIDLSILGPPVIEDYVLWENQVVMDSASISGVSTVFHIPQIC